MKVAVEEAAKDFGEAEDFTIWAWYANRINNRTVFVPAIVERNQSVSLETVVEEAIDRGIIVGIKANAAKSIAEGIAEELYHQFSLKTEDFSWHLVGGENFPRIEYVLTGDTGAVRGEVQRGKIIAVSGINLDGAKGVRLPRLDDLLPRLGAHDARYRRGVEPYG